MNAWLETLSGLEYAALLVAVPATLIMVIQTLLLIFGLHNETDGDGDFDDGDIDLDGDFDADGDFDGDFDADLDGDLDADLDGDADTDLDGDSDADSGPDDSGGDGNAGLFAGLHILTLRGVVAFLAIFGWGTLWLLRIGLHPLPALFFGVAMGVWAMVLVALLLRVALRLQEDGTVRIQNALGLSATVYLTIPPARQGVGKVTVLVQEHLTEFDALTDDPEALPTGSHVLVIGVSGRDVLIVTRT